MDIFSFGASEPLRVEFFGDSVTSLRQFDINSQLSGKTLPSATITASFTLNGPDEAEKATILDYLPPSAIILIDDHTEFLAMENHGEIANALSRFTIVRRIAASPIAIDFHATAQQKINANFRLFATLLHQKSATAGTPVFAASSQREIRELNDFLAEEMAETGKGSAAEAIWVPLNLHSGFSFGPIDLYTESDIFGKLHSHRSSRKRKIKGISLGDLQKLKVGDFVVHEDYGIGRFKALETITAGNSDSKISCGTTSP